MPKTSDASSFTQFQKINAQSLPTTGKVVKTTAVSATTTVAAVTKASTVAAAAAPKTAIVTVSDTKVNTKKRG